MTSALILYCSVLLSCVFFFLIKSIEVQIHKLSEINDNVEIRLKYGCSTQQHTGKKSVYFIA